MAIGRRRFTQGLAAGAALSALPFRAGAQAAGTMSGLAKDLLAAMTADQRRDAVLDFNSADRLDWHFTPRSRPGVTLEVMSEAARARLRDLLGELLSAQGLSKLDGVAKLEKVLHDRAFFSSFRNPLNYAIVFFGRPSDTDAWAWRYEGHHASLSATVVPGFGVAATPAFFGANPDTVTGDHEHAGLQVLKAEAELAFELIGGLDAGLMRRAVLPGHEPDDIVAGPGRERSIREITGLAVAEMPSAARGVAENLLNAYVGNMASDIAARETARVREAGWQTLRFGWAGATEPGRAHYYRLHGPTVLIEYDNTQGGATHVHSVWHNPTNLFGADMLKRHYAKGGH